jgi:predicted nucleotidyltransferase
MKPQDGIREVLKRFKPILTEKYKVKQIGVFGSWARGEQSEESDVDLLVEFAEPIGWEFVDVKEFLEQILGRPVDLVTAAMLRPSFKNGVLSEVVYA